MKIELPVSDYPLLIRTDFTNEAKWNEIVKGIQSPKGGYEAVLEVINDRQFDGLRLEQLPQFETDQEEENFIFLADATSIANEEGLLRCIDLADNYGSAIRVRPRDVAEVANNLFITNVFFEELQCTTDKDGIYLGTS